MGTLSQSVISVGCHAAGQGSCWQLATPWLAPPLVRPHPCHGSCTDPHARRTPGGLELQGGAGGRGGAGRWARRHPCKQAGRQASVWAQPPHHGEQSD